MRISGAPKLLSNMLCLLLSGVLAWGILEFSLRAELFQPIFRMGDLAFVLDTKILYKIKPRCHTEINQYGFRGMNFSEKKQSNIFFLGDSFVFGTNVSGRESLPERLEGFLGKGKSVLNFGVQGYGPDQSLVQFEKWSEVFKPSAVILAVYPANDFMDLVKNDLFETDESLVLKPKKNKLSDIFPSIRILELFRMLQLRFRPDQYRGTFDRFDPQSVHHTFVDFFNDVVDLDLIHNPDSWVSQRKRLLMRSIIRTFKEHCAKRDIPFWVVVIPTGENFEEESDLEKRGVFEDERFFLERIMAEILREEKVNFIDLSKPFVQSPQRGKELYDFKDGHLSAEGYRLSAEFIAKEIDNE